MSESEHETRRVIYNRAKSVTDNSVLEGACAGKTMSVLMDSRCI